ncbi:MAG: hypothetical protein ACK56F_31015, partial [bacterium]
SLRCGEQVVHLVTASDGWHFSFHRCRHRQSRRKSIDQCAVCSNSSRMGYLVCLHVLSVLFAPNHAHRHARYNTSNCRNSDNRCF